MTSEHLDSWDLTRAMLESSTGAGVLGAALRHHLARPGKQVRGWLALECSLALGVGVGRARQLAVACELIHNASLVHDDVQDRDAMRRGHSTVWHRFGDEIAISLGDELLVHALSIVADLNRVSPDLAPLFRTTISTVIRGQCDELVRRGERILSHDDYEEIAAAKTGAMLALTIVGSLTLANAHAASRSTADRIATLAGTAFQIHDDLLDVDGTKGRGLPGSDLLEGKLSWPWIAFLDEATPETRDRLLALLGQPDRRKSDVLAWIHELQASAAPERARSRARQLLRQAELLAGQLPASIAACVKRRLLQPIGNACSEGLTTTTTSRSTRRA